MKEYLSFITNHEEAQKLVEKNPDGSIIVGRVKGNGSFIHARSRDILTAKEDLFRMMVTKRFGRFGERVMIISNPSRN